MALGLLLLVGIAYLVGRLAFPELWPWFYALRAIVPDRPGARLAGPAHYSSAGRGRPGPPSDPPRDGPAMIGARRLPRTRCDSPPPTNPGSPGLVSFIFAGSGQARSRLGRGWGWGWNLADATRATTTTPLPSPPPTSGLPDLRKIKPRPGQARGAWGGSRPRLPHELIPFQRDTAQRKFKAAPSPPGEFSARDGRANNPRLSQWSRNTIWRESPKKFKTG